MTNNALYSHVVHVCVTGFLILIQRCHSAVEVSTYHNIYMYIFLNASTCISFGYLINAASDFIP